MKRFIFLLFIASILPFLAPAQNTGQGEMSATDAKPFVILERSDDVNNYFQVDFSLLAERFEKIYFLQLIFQDHRIVNTDGDLSKDLIGFQASIKHDTDEMLKLFDKYRQQVASESSGMDAASKAAWLEKNDKYKTK